MRELQLQFVSNPVTVRWLRVLNVIEREQQFTIVNLSKRLTVSQRTLIADIGYLKTYFTDSAIFSYQNNRYTFKETDRLLYQEQKQQFLESEILFEILGNIFYGEQDSIAALSEYYNYSESTLRRFLTLAQKPLSEYGLELSATPLTIVGKEEAIRKFFFDFYYEGAQTPHTLHPPKELHTHLLEVLRTITDKQQLGSGYTITAFYYLLYITMERSRQGFHISLPPEIKDLDKQEEDFQLLISLQPFINRTYGIYLSEEEFSWIHLQLLSKRTIDRKDWEEVFFTHFNQWEELNALTTIFLNTHGINQKKQPELPSFLNAFFLTRKINDKIHPVLNKMMKEEKTAIQASYSAALRRNRQFLEEHAELLGITKQYFDDIVFSLTLYSDILFHYYSPARTILFLLEGESLIVQYIQAQAQQLLGYRHTIRYLKIEELTEQELNDTDIDLLVTNYSPYVSDYRFTKDYVLMNQVPDQQDWVRVLNKLNSLVIDPF